MYAIDIFEIKKTTKWSKRHEYNTTTKEFVCLDYAQLCSLAVIIQGNFIAERPIRTMHWQKAVQ